MENMLQGFILVTGMIGQILIAHQRREAFHVWLLSNAALLWVSMSNQLWGMVALYLIFSAMCLYSIRKWKQKETYS